MADKIRVYNTTNGFYGIRTLSNTEYNIVPGSFVMLTEDDIAFIESNTAYRKRPFATGRLTIEEGKKQEVSESVGIQPDEENYFFTDEEIDKKLKGNMKAMEKWLDGIEDMPLLFKIAERAKALDLASSKMKMIDAKVPSAGVLG